MLQAFYLDVAKLDRDVAYILSGIKIPGYPIDGEIRHPARLLKPHRRGPGKIDPLKALTACQSLEVESQPPSRPSLAERSRAR
jgi:hypothetical protein